MGFAEGFTRTYKLINEDWADPRTAHFPLVSSLSFSLGICASYLLFIVYIGPKIMKHRQPLQIERLVIFYNIVQICITGGLFIAAVRACYWPLKYSLFCQPVEKGTTEEEMWIAKLVWYYYIIKLIDLLDTVFIVLRKKSSQLSVLHLYHHTGMVLAAWIGVRYVPGGQSMLLGTINCFVHVIMYMYYLLTALEPKYRSSWWKKHVTHLQLGQFAVIAFHHFLVIISTECNYPKIISILLMPFCLLLVALFVNFYRSEYSKEKST